MKDDVTNGMEDWILRDAARVLSSMRKTHGFVFYAGLCNCRQK